MGADVWIRRVIVTEENTDRSLDAMMRERAPCLLAVARRLLRDEGEARELVELAMVVARNLLPEFRTSSKGDWLQGLVVGLAVARAEQLRHT
jgi:DNA-directed RNA polymerase specialized sigma24 family protein